MKVKSVSMRKGIEGAEQKPREKFNMEEANWQKVSSYSLGWKSRATEKAGLMRSDKRPVGKAQCNMVLFRPRPQPRPCELYWNPVPPDPIPGCELVF